jgi:hypothetical protein
MSLVVVMLAGLLDRGGLEPGAAYGVLAALLAPAMVAL